MIMSRYELGLARLCRRRARFRQCRICLPRRRSASARSWIWAFVGNAYARQIFTLPLWDRKWIWGIFYELRWYLFLVNRPQKYVGHNPLAHVSMFLLMLLLTFMVVTGFALYSEGAGRDSWQYKLFGWVFSIWPNSQDIHTWHHLGMWGVVIFVITHVYTAVREDIMSRQSLISAMISGERVFRDDTDS